MRRSFSQLHNVHIRSWDDQDIEGYADLLADPEAMKAENLINQDFSAEKPFQKGQRRRRQ